MHPWPRLLVVLALLMILLPPAAARQPDPEWAEQARAISMAHGASNFQFDSIRQPDADDLLRGSFSLASGEFRFSYASFDEGNESLLQWEVAPLALVEFRDADQNMRLDVGEPIVRRVPLRDLAGASLLVQPDGLQGYTIGIRYPFNATRPDLLPVIDPTQRGELEIRLDVLARSRTMDGVEVAPTTVPIAFEIERYPFNASDTRIALEIRASSNRALASSANALKAAHGAYEAGIAWSPSARVGGISQPAGVTLLEAPAASTSRSSRIVYASYGQAERIEHRMQSSLGRYEGDGLVGDLADLVRGDWRAYTVGFLAAGALTGATAWRRLRS